MVAVAVIGSNTQFPYGFDDDDVNKAVNVSIFRAFIVCFPLFGDKIITVIISTFLFLLFLVKVFKGFVGRKSESLIDFPKRGNYGLYTLDSHPDGELPSFFYDKLLQFFSPMLPGRSE